MSTVLEESRAQTTPPEAVIPTYVWDVPVRVTHWLIFLSIVVLAFTGIYIGRPFLVAPGVASERFVMGTMKYIHSLAAIVFTLSVVARIIWMFVGSPHARWRAFVPVERQRRSGLVDTLRFYLFLRDRPPEYAGHNPLAGAAYLVVFLLYLTMIATGFAMYSVSAHVNSPTRIFAFLVPLFGGPQMARWLHHMGMWLLLGFAVHHVYSALLVAHVERNGTIGSIFAGWKFLPRRMTDGQRDDDA
jgi:Ni/Fe-hydrogenase 1 B-type cytochrome subunit